jgi:hypothetical protein
MPKRKRDGNEIHEEEDRASKIRKSRFRVKVEQGNKSIASALKLARGFERQKLGRRQKTAKDDAKEQLRLKDEVTALKALDLGQTAQKYLFKQLVKTKRIKESPTFVAIYGEEPVVETPKPGAEANVVGRLFNSNPIKQVMPGIMKGILGCLGLETTLASGVDKKAKGPEPPAKQRAAPRPGRSEEDEFDGFSAEEDAAYSPSNPLETRDNDSEDIQDDGMADYDDRLASDSSNDSESASSGLFQHSYKIPNGTTNYSTVVDEISLSPSPPPEPVQKKPVKAAKAAPKPSGTTTFLPSLMLGGYYSGSDSDEDGDGYLESRKDPSQPKQRKNRRGQRARQEIAEKKYGGNANHLKKAAAKEARSRDAGWDARRGATEGRDRGRGFGSKMGGRSNSKRPTGANADAVVGQRGFGAAKGMGEAKAKEKERPLHPSWEAAKKRKEQGLGTAAAFSGKKITFD